MNKRTLLFIHGHALEDRQTRCKYLYQDTHIILGIHVGPALHQQTQTVNATVRSGVYESSIFVLFAFGRFAAATTRAESARHMQDKCGQQ